MGKAKRSAGVLIYRHADDGLAVLLVHPGGPFWRNRDAGAWQIPKGEIEPEEQPMAAARREVEEELGLALHGDLIPLATIRQKAGKIVEVFTLEQEIDPATVAGNSFDLEWPPGSGSLQSFPEIDAAAWFSLAEAESAMLASQRPLLAGLRELVSPGHSASRAGSPP